ncbi:MAG: hypothetical protein G8237_12445 [Magnetococcales bacterium]|nr:hypothetical protein [Magnetococcales bacterium]NGZ07152.1 hypothetical protein [Magnetococcales bacterium]
MSDPVQPDDTSPQASPPESPEPDAVDHARRRRLLKGLIGAGVAVPVIMTLQRDALATFGSQQACFDNITALGAGDDPCQSAGDDWIRDSRVNFSGQPNLGVLTGGGGVNGDQCLLFYKPDVGWWPYKTDSSNMYGKTAAGYKPVTYSCWTSLHNTPGTGAPNLP